MAKQLALDKRRSQGTAIDRDKRFARASGKLVNQPREARLAATPEQIAMALSKQWIVNKETNEATALPGATLSGLAWAMTGNASDYTELRFPRHPPTLREGDTVDITLLLRKAAGEPVETSTRDAAADALKGLPEIPEMFEGDPRPKRVLWLSRVAAYAQKAKRDSGHRVFVSVQLAQGALETGWGHSESFKRGHSFLGVKGRGDAGTGTYATTEVVGGKQVPIRDMFAHYSSVYESLRAQGVLISTAKRYEKAANAKTPEEQIRHIRYGGYATAPPEEYIRAIIRIMEQYNLKKYDLP